MSSGKVLLGVLAGFAAGAIAGILFAPDKGSETRKKLSKMGDEFTDAFKEKLNQILDEITEKSENEMKETPESAKQAKAGNESFQKDTKAASAV